MASYSKDSYENVEAYLEAQRRGRPQSFEEIRLKVNKHHWAVARELSTLVLYGKVRVIVLRFNGRDCAFYTMRKDVKIDIIKGATKY